MELIQVCAIVIQWDKSINYSSMKFLENMMHSSGGSGGTPNVVLVIYKDRCIDHWERTLVTKELSIVALT